MAQKRELVSDVGGSAFPDTANILTSTGGRGSVDNIEFQKSSQKGWINIFDYILIWLLREVLSHTFAPSGKLRSKQECFSPL